MNVEPHMRVLVQFEATVVSVGSGRVVVNSPSVRGSVAVDASACGPIYPVVDVPPLTPAEERDQWHQDAWRDKVRHMND